MSTTSDNASYSMKKYFNPDRFRKYGWGVLRLILVVIFAFTWTTTTPTIITTSKPLIYSDLYENFIQNITEYYLSKRWIAHIYIGSIGAIVNVQTAGVYVNISLLILAAALITYDICHFDYCLLVYLVKTFGGDYFAGKLDTLEWLTVLFFTFGILVPTFFYMEVQSTEIFLQYARIILALFSIQLTCEYGDAHWEQSVFFRHRYSFEIFTVLLLQLLPDLQHYELTIIRSDLVICLFYRLSNLAVCIFATNQLSALVNLLLFYILSLYTGHKMQYITSAEVATLILKQSSHKGNALEKYIASPAWLPILSLESVDGDLWKEMRHNFDSMLKTLPEPARLVEITTHATEQLISTSSKNKTVIDAHVLARLTVEIFCEYLFGKVVLKHTEYVSILVQSSWEWRREIAARGKGNMSIKIQAIRTVLEEFLPENKDLFALFGSKWKEPKYFSLIMQPFVISPMINVGDVMCAYKLQQQQQHGQTSLTLEQSLRHMHPFPIFERWIDHDIIVDGEVVVHANTQCAMFTADLKESDYLWPVFGAGPRSCAGVHLATPMLKALIQAFSKCEPHIFQPLLGHKYSGRHLDGRSSSYSEGISESIYFTKAIVLGLIEAGKEKSKSTRNHGCKAI